MKNIFTSLNRSLEQNTYNLHENKINKQPNQLMNQPNQLMNQPNQLMNQTINQNYSQEPNQDYFIQPNQLINQDYINEPNQIINLEKQLHNIEQLLSEQKQKLEKQKFELEKQEKQKLEFKLKLESRESIEPIDDGLPEIECNKQLKIMKKDLSNSILKYIDLLCDELLQNEIISINEIQNIKYKIKNNQIDNNTIINYLENKKTLHKQISISGGDKFTQVPPNFDNILSGKWQVPMPRPPVCINNFSSFL
jgi:hypothetical protein